MSVINLILLIAAFCLGFFVFTFVGGTLYHLAELVRDAYRAKRGTGTVTPGMA